VKGVELTEAGRQVQQLVNPVFSSFDHLTAELRGEKTGTLRVATTALGAYNYIPRILADFRAAFPTVSVSVRIRSEAEVIALAESGLVDFAIAAAPAHSERLTATAKTRISFHLVASRDHRWPAGSLSWGQVLEQPLIVPERVSGIRLSLEDLLTRRKLISKLVVSAEVTSAELAVELVRSGFGVALIPYAPRLAESLVDLCVVDVPPGLTEKNIAVMHNNELYQPTYMRRFLEIAALAIRAGREIN
jgi:DNA-binding transcriptional LysR family regulator